MAMTSSNLAFKIFWAIGVPTHRVSWLRFRTLVRAFHPASPAAVVAAAAGVGLTAAGWSALGALSAGPRGVVSGSQSRFPDQAKVQKSCVRSGGVTKPVVVRCHCSSS